MGDLSTFPYAKRRSRVNPNRIKRPRLPKSRNRRSQNHINPEIVHIQLAPLTIRKHRLLACIANTMNVVRTVLHKVAQSTAFNQWRDFFGVSATISSLHLHVKNMPLPRIYYPQNWQVPGKRCRNRTKGSRISGNASNQAESMALLPCWVFDCGYEMAQESQEQSWPINHH